MVGGVVGQVGALTTAVMWIVWLILSLLGAPIATTHVTGFIASFITAYNIARRVMTRGEAPPGVSLMVASVALVAAGLAAEYVIIILPGKASLDIALSPPLSAIGYVLAWGGLATFAVSAALTVLDAAFDHAKPQKPRRAEERKRRLTFGGR